MINTEKHEIITAIKGMIGTRENIKRLIGYGASDKERERAVWRQTKELCRELKECGVHPRDVIYILKMGAVDPYHARFDHLQNVR